MDSSAVPVSEPHPDAAKVAHGRTTLRLWLCGLGMLVPAGAFAWRYPLRGNAGSLTDVGILSRYSQAGFNGYVAGMVALFLLYLLALREARRLPARRALPPIFACGTALVALMAWLYPVNAIDIYIYAVRSRLLTHYRVDPIAVKPIVYWHDPYTHFASRQWADTVSPYGPLWNLIAAPATIIGGGRIAVALVAFKILAAACVLIGAWLICRLLAGSRPEDAATGVLFYLWNPVVLWEGVGNGHNDVVMAIPILLAFLAWTKRRDGWVIPLLVVSALIKYVTILIIPAALVVVWRRAEDWPARRRLVAQSLAGTVLVGVVALFPFYDLNAVRQSITGQGSFVITSPAAMAVDLLQPRYSYDQIKQGARWIGAGGVAVAILWGMISAFRRPSVLPRAAFEIMFVYLFAGALTVRGWYLIWLVALAALLPWGWPHWRAITWTIGALAIYAVFIWIWAWWRVDYGTVQNVAILAMFGPPLLVTGVEVLTHLTARRPPRLSQRAARSSPTGDAGAAQDIAPDAGEV